MRILFVYDCLYPHTIGGFERFYRDLATRLARKHEVTYLTRVQWDRGAAPDIPEGVKLVALNCGRDLYTTSGRRRVGPPVIFGLRVLSFLMRHRAEYDIVQTCSFPYFPMLSCAAVRAVGGPPIVTDWIEVWSDQYWQRYLGPLAGRIGAFVQRLCTRLTSNAFTLSALSANALRANGYRKPMLILKGLATTPVPETIEAERDPVFIFAGRHIPEKHIDAIPAAIEIARRSVPQLRALIFGDGPERSKVRQEIRRLHLEDVIECPGFVPWPQLNLAMRRAAGLILPSEREGYGSVVIEAIAQGTPVIAVPGPDNAATSLVIENVTGSIASSVEPAVLADSIVKVCAAGPALRERAHAWYRSHAAEISIDASIEQIEEVYGRIVSCDAATNER